MGLDRALASLIAPNDWACLSDSDDGEEDLARLLEYEYWCGDTLANAEFDLIEWVTEVIKANPGIWTAELCRRRNEIASDNAGIAWCGLCSDYANPRKRKRSKNLNLTALLPGFEEKGGGFQVHEPCSSCGLRRMRYVTDRLAEAGKIEKRKNQRIPDIRQARGWDFGTRLYPKEVHRCEEKK